MDQADEGALRHFGISADAETVWRLLLTEPSLNCRELASESSLTVDRVTCALATLIEANLARRSDARAGATVVDPVLAIGTHLARYERKIALEAEELAELRSKLPDLALQYSKSRAAIETQPAFEVVLGLDNVRRQLYFAIEQAKFELRNLDHAPAVAGMRHARDVEIETLGRGIRDRSIFSAKALTEPGIFAEVEAVRRLGNEIRTLPDVPTRLLSIDSDLAVVPVDPSDLSIGAIFIRTQSLVDVFVYMFDRLWAEADPIFTVDRAEDRPTHRAARVLELIAIGTKDERIARSLGVGTRTVRREVAELRTTLGVHSRAEITAAAIRRGWLPQE